MINFVPKSKVSKKPAKKTRKVLRARKRVSGNDLGLTPADIAEMNMFAAAIAKMNWKHEKKNWAKTVAEYKKYHKADSGA